VGNPIHQNINTYFVYSINK